VRSTHPLASREIIEPHDLSGLRIGIHDKRLVPGLHAFLEANAPNSILINGTKGPVSAFDTCKGGGVFLMTEDFGQKLRPFRIIPFNCPLTCTYGLAFKANPSPLVQMYINSAKELFLTP